MMDTCHAYCECPGCGKPFIGEVPFAPEYAEYMKHEDEIRHKIPTTGFVCFFHPARRVLCHECQIKQEVL